MYRPAKIKTAKDIPHWNKLEGGGIGGKSAGLNFIVPKGSTGIYNPSEDVYIFEPVEAMESHSARQDPDGTIWYVIYKNWQPRFRGDFVEVVPGYFEILDKSKQLVLL